MTETAIPLSIYVVSDATGQTAEAVTRAVLVQFPDLRPDLKRFSGVRTREQVTEIVETAGRNGGNTLVIYSLVAEDLRAFLLQEGKRRDLVLFDLLGPILEKVRQLFHLVPLSQPGLLAHVQERSLQVAAAIDFTLKHDDGLGLESVREADLIILGISRTSKTPTSIYLACNHALKVANIPLLPGQDVPVAHMEPGIPRVGLTIDPERLAAIRREYVPDLREYTDLKQIHREVEHALQVFRRFPGTAVIDVTHRSIEETAGRILESVSPSAGGRTSR